MNMPSPGDWSKISEEFQHKLTQSWGQALQAFQTMDLGGIVPADAKKSLPSAPKLKFEQDKLKALQSQYMEDAAALWNGGLNGTAPLKDRRFSSDAWASNPVASFTAGSYLLNARTLMGLADAVDADAQTQNRIRFAVEQWVAATAPSNFLAFNAEAQKKAIETKGESLAKGMQNLMHDMKQGHVSMTDESLFEVGKNVATTEGAVVYENEYFQLIEYKPLTAKVYEKPFLLVPPCINKFYILDLQPENSFIRYAVAQGHRTLVVSWNNPKESMAGATWEHYIEHGVLQAIEVATDLSPKGQINTLGFCVGGTMLTCALAVLAARGESPVSSATLLTTLVDFSNTGILDVFIDEPMVQMREMQYANGGLLHGRDLAQTFSFLRPNELVWNYVVGNYLKGQTPAAFDLLYWNSDATNLPGPFYAWYLRNTYLENRLVKPGLVEICGESIDMGAIQLPVFIYGSQEDHIVPVEAAYASTQIFKGPKTFVMGASGHIAGVINPPEAHKRSHWVSTKRSFPAKLQTWVESAKEVPGSWWPHWAEWLQAQAGERVPAPKRAGNVNFKPIESAPGRYVAVKV
jgi:polyhydroxyalkanoate synthase